MGLLCFCITKGGFFSSSIVCFNLCVRFIYFCCCGFLCVLSLRPRASDARQVRSSPQVTQLFTHNFCIYTSFTPRAENRISGSVKRSNKPRLSRRKGGIIVFHFISFFCPGLCCGCPEKTQRHCISYCNSNVQILLRKVHLLWFWDSTKKFHYEECEICTKNQEVGGRKRKKEKKSHEHSHNLCIKTPSSSSLLGGLGV